MSVRGVAAVALVESVKLYAQFKARLVLAVCVAGPFAFALIMRMQSSLPEDTLFGRSVKHSGFALPLVVLGFAGLWALPVLTSVIGGDLFAQEDRYGTWTTLLLRSRTRGEMFVGKTVAALVFSVLAVSTLAASSIGAGLIVLGTDPLISLSGLLLAPSEAFNRVALSWLSVLPPVLGLTALAVLVSVASRSSVAGIGIPVAVVMVMQLYALVDGPEMLRRAMITSGFVAWHGLLVEPRYYAPLIHSTVVSTVYFVASLLIAYQLLQRRDIGR